DNLRNNSKEINEYVNNLKDEIKTFKYIYNTGNMILDIIINEKNLENQEQQYTVVGGMDEDE
ncbi:ATP-binding protein, partial [Clostridioides difficile]